MCGCFPIHQTILQWTPTWYPIIQFHSNVIYFEIAEDATGGGLSHNPVTTLDSNHVSTWLSPVLLNDHRNSLLRFESFASRAHRTHGNTYVTSLLQKILQRIQLSSQMKRSVGWDTGCVGLGGKWNFCTLFLHTTFPGLPPVQQPGKLTKL
jgi:hypothetical protein